MQPPLAGEFRTDLLGPGLKVLAYTRRDQVVTGHLNYAWRSEEHATALRLFTGSPDLGRLQRAMPDIERLARGVAINQERLGIRETAAIRHDVTDSEQNVAYSTRSQVLRARTRKVGGQNDDTAGHAEHCRLEPARPAAPGEDRPSARARAVRRGRRCHRHRPAGAGGGSPGARHPVPRGRHRPAARRLAAYQGVHPGDAVAAAGHHGDLERAVRDYQQRHQGGY